MSTAQQFSKGVAWIAAGTWAEQAINILVFITLVRLLGAEIFGLVAMAGAFVIIAEFLVRESISEYLIAARAPGQAACDTVFWLLVGAGLGLTLALFLGSGPIARYYGEPQVQSLIIALSVTVPFIALTAVPVALLRRDLRFRALSLRAVAGVLAGGIVGLAMAWQGAGVWSIVGQRLAHVATNVTLAWFAVQWRPGLTASRAELRKILGFGSQMMLFRAAELSVIQIPFIIIGATLGAATLGVFTIAWRLVEVAVYFVATPLRVAAQPSFAAETRQGSAAADLLMDVHRVAGYLAFPIFAGLACVAAPMLHVLFGSEWDGAAPILSVLALMGVYFCIERVQTSFCLAAGRIGALTMLAWLEVAVVALAVLAVVARGLGPVSVAFVAPFFGLWVFRLRVVARLAGRSALETARIHVRPLIGAAVMSLILVTLAKATPGNSAPVALILGVSTGMLVYLIFSALFMRDRVALLWSYIRLGAGSTKALG